MNEKADVHIFVWRATPAIQCARRFFSFIPQGNEENQHSILKLLGINTFKRDIVSHKHKLQAKLFQKTSPTFPKHLFSKYLRNCNSSYNVLVYM